MNKRRWIVVGVVLALGLGAVCLAAIWLKPAPEPASPTIAFKTVDTNFVVLSVVCHEGPWVYDHPVIARAAAALLKTRDGFSKHEHLRWLTPPPAVYNWLRKMSSGKPTTTAAAEIRAHWESPETVTPTLFLRDVRGRHIAIRGDSIQGGWLFVVDRPFPSAFGPFWYCSVMTPEGKVLAEVDFPNPHNLIR